MMLQQTQVARVTRIFPEFVQIFPDFQRLAAARDSEVLSAWKGLGYNRRALNLKRLAVEVRDRFDGSLPDDAAALQKLPGIGKATAQAIIAFAFNRRAVFIETNIRRIILDRFYNGVEHVSDKEIMPWVAAVLPRSRYREWYWALMDYGSALAKQKPNPNRRSAHYKKQKPFEGSIRQMRGLILRYLLGAERAKPAELRSAFGHDKRLKPALEGLKRESIISVQDGWLVIR
jgi:A/G-specific adenine glycosylase